jgi:hypothetical protein
MLYVMLFGQYPFETQVGGARREQGLATGGLSGHFWAQGVLRMLWAGESQMAQQAALAALPAADGLVSCDKCMPLPHTAFMSTSMPCHWCGN